MAELAPQTVRRVRTLRAVVGTGRTAAVAHQIVPQGARSAGRVDCADGFASRTGPRAQGAGAVVAVVAQFAVPAVGAVAALQAVRSTSHTAAVGEVVTAGAGRAVGAAVTTDQTVIIARIT